MLKALQEEEEQEAGEIVEVTPEPTDEELLAQLGLELEQQIADLTGTHPAEPSLRGLGRLRFIQGVPSIVAHGVVGTPYSAGFSFLFFSFLFFSFLFFALFFFSFRGTGCRWHRSAA